MTDRRADTPMCCTVAGGSLVGLSTAIALARLGFALAPCQRRRLGPAVAHASRCERSAAACPAQAGV